MITVKVDLPNKSYPIHVGSGLLQEVASFVEPLQPKGKIAIITDTNVGPLHLAKVEESLRSAGRTYSTHLVPAGEASKSLEVVGKLCSELIQMGHDRSSCVIALGGGVIGDLAGFVAAIFYRGIPVIQLPTTIVSQVDSSAGGKTGVNAPEGKNLIGSFHQPSLVLVDPETLLTLPDREFREGFAEVIKHAAIRDLGMFPDLERLDPSQRIVPPQLLAQNLAIKARIVEEDELETTGTRALLNFGHTIGHGIEASVPYGTLLHGEAIALGLRAELFLSEKFGGLPPSESQRVLHLLAKFGLPLQLSSEISTDQIVEKMLRDKKFSNGDRKIVILEALGQAKVTSDISLEEMRESIEHLRHPV